MLSCVVHVRVCWVSRLFVLWVWSCSCFGVVGVVVACRIGVDSRRGLSMCARCVYIRTDYGGSIPQDKASALSSGVVSISAARYAFAAIKDDGSVVAWGHSSTYIPLCSSCVLRFVVCGQIVVCGALC